MDIIESFKQKIAGRNFSVVFPEGKDERIIRAARILKDNGIAEPVVLGTSEHIETAAQKAGITVDDIKSINPKQSDKLDYYTHQYITKRGEVSRSVAKLIVRKPFLYAGMMVACGDCDAAVGGVASATAVVIQVGVLTIGLADGIETPSSYFLMVVPGFSGGEEKAFIYADCAVNIDPTAEQLADIALASAKSAERILDDKPCVAMLSFSTKASASAPSVYKVRKAVEIAQALAPKLAIDGEFQADAAIVPAVAAKKVKGHSNVAGKANVLIFPDLDSGNIAYKLTQYMAGAQAIGPFLQGFAKPITDLSRGSTVDDIVSATILTLAQLL